MDNKQYHASCGNLGHLFCGTHLPGIQYHRYSVLRAAIAAAELRTESTRRRKTLGPGQRYHWVGGAAASSGKSFVAVVVRRSQTRPSSGGVIHICWYFHVRNDTL
jgi:hypothetical protein